MPNLNHRFDWAQMGDKNMQISGIFSKIKMPILNGGLCAAVLLTYGLNANAATLLGTSDVHFAQGQEGQSCATGEGASDFIIVGCECGYGSLPRHYDTFPNCYDGGTLESNGCKYQGISDPDVKNYVAFCTTASSDACPVCNCSPQTPTWTSIGSNRVSRIVRTFYERTDKLICSYKETTEYGCAAGYYTTSTPSASMTCSRCPGLTTSSGTTQYGDSNEGNTSITGCYQPAYTTFEDRVGQYRFKSACSYTK